MMKVSGFFLSRTAHTAPVGVSPEEREGLYLGGLMLFAVYISQPAAPSPTPPGPLKQSFPSKSGQNRKLFGAKHHFWPFWTALTKHHFFKKKKKGFWLMRSRMAKNAVWVFGGVHLKILAKKIPTHLYLPPSFLGTSWVHLSAG